MMSSVTLLSSESALRIKALLQIDLFNQQQQSRCEKMRAEAERGPNISTQYSPSPRSQDCWLLLFIRTTGHCPTPPLLHPSPQPRPDLTGDW